MIKAIVENIFDIANEYLLFDEKKYYRIYSYGNKLLHLRSLLCLDGDLSGSWYGNDTICRTIIDLNKIAYYGGRDGKIYDTSQREIISIVDGIVSGQGEGPMRPLPNNTGLIVVSDSTALADICSAEIIGLKSNKLGFLRENRICSKFPLISREIKYIYNDNEIKFDEIKKIAPRIELPKRWGGIAKSGDLSKHIYIKKYFDELSGYPKRVKRKLRELREK